MTTRINTRSYADRHIVEIVELRPHDPNDITLAKATGPTLLAALREAISMLEGKVEAARKIAQCLVGGAQIGIDDE